MRLFESICIEYGQPQRLALHQQRVDRAFRQFFPEDKPLRLKDLPQLKVLPANGMRKARVVYNRSGLASFTLEEEYTPKIHTRIGLVEAPGFAYPHKLEDRRFFQSLFRLHPQCDDFIILHNGLLTDSTYCNLALHTGKRDTPWQTPAACLLPGTRLAQYLADGILQEARIDVTQLSSCKKIALINAMRSLGTYMWMEDVEFVKM